jgi:hypothetical protein
LASLVLPETSDAFFIALKNHFCPGPRFALHPRHREPEGGEENAMSIALPRHSADTQAPRTLSWRKLLQWQKPLKWRKPWTGTLPETSLYAMLFLWIGSEHNFTAAGLIAAVLALFVCFLPR